METTQTRSFVRTVLPWAVAAIALILYLITLDRVVTVQSVVPLARASGLDWHPVYTAPLTYLLTLPVRVLPSGAQLFGLNFMAALCAALTLALLARSVAILPHDRTQLQRDKALDENAFPTIRLAWVPILFAVAVCAFQRSFWESAIINTGEMLDLLVFAYCLRCALEYRIEEKNSWLYRMALLYGIGITNNFAMIGFFPILLTAVIWIKGVRFFRFDFLVRIFLFGLAGLSLYLLLPITQSNEEIGFWATLKTNLVWQKRLLFDNRKVVLFPAIYALIPLLLMGIHWRGGFGDQSAMGSLFSNIAAVLLHAGLLAFCVYVAFDPPASPRQIGAPFHYVFLPFYYLGALIVGYYSGFLLLVFSANPASSRRHSVFPPSLNLPVTALVCGGALFVAGQLVYENYPRIRQMPSRALHDYASALIQSLPDRAVVLSDDPLRLYAVESLLGRAARDKYMIVHAKGLGEPAYHQFLHKRYGDRFPVIAPFPGYSVFSMDQLIGLLGDLGRANELIYLHPSFGTYFEVYYLQPRNLVYALKLYPTNTIEAPAPGPEIVAQQKAYWDSLARGPLKALKEELATLPSDRRQRYESSAAYVGEFYARALDHWGVELQRAGRFEEASPAFETALALNPDNASALVNRDANAFWRKEGKPFKELSREHQEKLKLYRGMEFLLGTCGPVDEPSFLNEFASYFIAQGNLYRQAEQMILRGLFYRPNDLGLQISLADTYILGHQLDHALALVPQIRASTNAAAAVEAARIESSVQFEKGDFPGAVKTLEDVIRARPDLEAGYTTLVQLHLKQADRLNETNPAASRLELTNALKVVDSQLKVQPNNPSAFFMRGAVCVYTDDIDAATNAFTKVMELEKDNGRALLNRAIANLRGKRLEAAKADYEEHLRRFTPDYRVYYGLGEIAYQQKDWNTARERYTEYLRYAPANFGEVSTVRERLQKLKQM